MCSNSISMTRPLVGAACCAQAEAPHDIADSVSATPTDRASLSQRAACKDRNIALSLRLEGLQVTAVLARMR